MMILLVEDEPDIREMVVDFLGEEGFDVSACGRAEEALARIAHSLPDVLILDGRLPSLSGWECLDQLRASDRTAKLPILLLTAAHDDLERRRGQAKDECTAFLSKPFAIDDVLDAIRAVTEACHRRTTAVQSL